MQLTKEHFDKTLGNFNKTLGSFDKSISGLKSSVSNLENTVGDLVSKVISIEERMATKEDLAKFEGKFGKVEGRIDKIEAKMVTKDDLKTALDAQTLELQDYVHQSFEVQQDYMDERFGELVERYDVRERVGVLEKDVAVLKLSK